MISTLVNNGWTCRPATNPASDKLPPWVPSELRSFCCSFDVLWSPDDTFWFFSHMDYLGLSDSAFKWNEFEINDFEYAVNDVQREAVRKFWKEYFPIAMSVRDDHAYMAIGIGEKSMRRIIWGENSDESEIRPLATSLDDLFASVERFYTGDKMPALSRFL